MTRDEILQVVHILNKEGKTIIEIEGCFYDVIEFNPAQGLSREHHLRARDLTSMFSGERVTFNFNRVNEQLREMLTEIQSKDPVERNFHIDTRYITYLPC
jgi:hypothetical protein